MPNFNLDQYVPVNQRIEQFYAKHPQGRILTTVLEHHEETGFILIKAEVFREPDDAAPSSTGHAFEERGTGHVNKTSYIENCETGAVGRALAMLGFEVQRGVASREEMQKVERQQQRPPVPSAAEEAALDEEIMALLKLLERDNASLNAWAAKKWNLGSVVEWDELSVQQRGVMVEMLRREASKLEKVG